MRIGWRGIFPALSTPCDDSGALDEGSLREQVRWNIDKGTHGVIVSLMAGEFHKFSDQERMRTYEIVVKEARGKVPVLVGPSHSGTEVVIQLSQYAAEIGADGICVLPPFFNMHDGKAALCLYDHYAAIASRVDLPLMIQDAENTAPYMCASLFRRLATDLNNVVAVKLEGPRSFEKAKELKELAPDVAIFGGMAALNMYEELRLGVAGNVPAACLTDVLVGVYELFVQDKVGEAETLFKRYKKWLNFLHLHSISNDEVEKETLRQRGIIRSSFTRLPHGPLLTAEDKAELNQVLAELGLLP